ncbi:MAG: peptidase S8, partial [Longimicrobiaceae bacterium]
MATRKAPSKERSSTATSRRPRRTGTAATEPKAPPPPHLPSEPPRPTHRLLRGYSFDPSMSTSLETALVSEITYKVPWEPLKRGPIGEYLEVVDYDPPSGCYYAPVDLNNERILAQNGLKPSEGNPQFHQQMV